MSKIQRGFKIAAVLLGLLAVGTLAEVGTQATLQAQTGCSSCDAAAAAAETVYAEPAAMYSQPVYTASASSACGCSSSVPEVASSGCGCGKKVAPRKCGCRKRDSSPGCGCEYCELEAKKGEVEKTGFKVEQKEICVPPVRLPWKKCCPPTRTKVRTVNVLKKDKYKVPQCQYKWKVHEPEEIKEPEPAEPTCASCEAAAGSGELSLTPEEMKDFDLAPGEKIISVTSDPAEALGDVPRPPSE